MGSRDNKLFQFSFWLVRLRWIGVIGIILATAFSSRIMDISVKEFNLYAVSGVFLILNVVYTILFNRITKLSNSNQDLHVRYLINFQIAADFVILTVMLHYSGGIENPFIIYYIFHMIMASIILSSIESFMQVTFALVLIGLLTISEYSGFIPHYSLNGFVSHELYKSGLYLIGTGVIFVTTSYLVAYITNRLARQSREHEKAYLKANQELERKDAIKNEYVLRITHDIKAHLAAIQSCISIVVNKTSPSDNNTREEFLKRAYNRTKVLTRFIQDLLYMTRLKLIDKIKSEEFPVRDSIRKIAEDVINRAKEKSVDLQVDIEESVDKISAIRVSFEELVTNLLINAINYSKEKSEVNLNVKKHKNGMLVEIIDQGMGIPVKEQEFIFDEFYRASNAKAISAEGTGLGLSIARQIVQSHGGKIWVESEEGSGSKFCFILPQ
ncbi:MAG: HAMP domain-containing histidine kinase [Bacteroidales bacterium]|nr:HAMP domain-containing histidine kinase [Bacteroidales bacterium]